MNQKKVPLKMPQPLRMVPLTPLRVKKVAMAQPEIKRKESLI